MKELYSVIWSLINLGLIILGGWQIYGYQYTSQVRYCAKPKGMRKHLLACCLLFLMTTSGCLLLPPSRHESIMSSVDKLSSRPSQDLLFQGGMDEDGVLQEAPSFVYADQTEPFAQFIVEERQLIATQNLVGLGLLWSKDAQIIDGRSTESTEDDYIWSGRAAILDRYKVAVFPTPPPLLDLPTDLEIECVNTNGQPSDALDCMLADSEFREALLVRVKRGGDLWEFTWQEGRWWISGLTYSSP